MARLPALVKTYAAIDGQSERTIQWFARQAREQGFIASGKRGAGAKVMNVADAVNLILTCNSDPDPKLAPKRIERMRGASQGFYDSTRHEFVPESMEAVIASQKLGDALEALIRSAATIHAELLARCDKCTRTDQAMIEDPFNAMIGLDVSLWMFGAEFVIREGNVVHGSDVLFRLEYTEVGTAKSNEGKPARKQTRYVLPLEVFRACGIAVLGGAEDDAGGQA